MANLRTILQLQNGDMAGLRTILQLQNGDMAARRGLLQTQKLAQARNARPRRLQSAATTGRRVLPQFGTLV